MQVMIQNLYSELLYTVALKRLITKNTELDDETLEFSSRQKFDIHVNSLVFDKYLSGLSTQYPQQYKINFQSVIRLAKSREITGFHNEKSSLCASSWSSHWNGTRHFAPIL